jgi:hypothetical protein
MKWSQKRIVVTAMALLLMVAAGVVLAAGNITTTYGTSSALTVTNLQSLASSATAGWQSALVDNSSTKAREYSVFLKLTTANTAPANDKAAYIYACPVYNDGSTAYYSDQGTGTLPTGSEGTTTIATPNNLRLVGVLNYTTQQQIMQGVFNVRLADLGNATGFSLVVVNYTGAALSTGCIVDVRPISTTLP